MSATATIPLFNPTTEIDFSMCPSYLQLRGKRQDFVIEYVKDHNGTQAAIRARYSEKTARSIASELLTKPDVSAAIEEIERIIQSKKVATAQEIREFLTNAKRLKITDICSWDADGGVVFHKNSEELEPHIAELVNGISVTRIVKTKGKETTETVRTKLSVVDKKDAVKLLGQDLGMFKSTLEWEGSLVMNYNDISPEEREKLKKVAKEYVDSDRE